MERRSFIQIHGAYGAANFGDDLLMKVCSDFICKRLPDWSFDVSDQDCQYTSTILGTAKSFSPSSGYADLLLYGGGTQFFGFPRSLTSRLRKYVGRRFRTIQDKMPDRRVAARTAAIGIGLGPFVRNPNAESYAKATLQAMDFVAVRDRISLDYCHRWGISSAFLGADICFLSEFTSEVPRQAQPREGSVAVVVRDWFYQKTGYEQRLIDAVAQMRRRGLVVRYVSFAKKADQRWLRWLRESNEDVLSWDPENDSINDFLELLGGFKCIVTARFHGAVVGALLHRHVVCVGIEPKLDLISENLGDNASHWKSPFDADELAAHVQQAIQTTGNMADTPHAIELQSQRAEEMVDRFVRFARQEGKWQ